MKMEREEVENITAAAIALCRREVDQELMRLHEQDRANAWTEERARKVAEDAADIAVERMTDRFYMGVGKRTLVVLGVTVVVMWDSVKTGVSHGIKKLMGVE